MVFSIKMAAHFAAANRAEATVDHTEWDAP
jgi:hypothetical protein